MQDSISPFPSEKATAQTISDIERLSGDLLIFRTTRPPDYRFQPGQYSRLGLPDSDGSFVWRPFSVTSGPKDEFLEYYGVLVPGGLFTGLLGKLAQGADIWIEKQLYGFMTIDRFVDGEDLWLLSTGTGLGPFISILRDETVWGKFRRIIVAHGVKRSTDHSYRDVLQAMQYTPRPSGSASLHVIEAVTREEGTTPDQLQGRLTALLEDGQLERAAGVKMTPETSRVMMCGNPAMIEDMRKLLHARDMRPCRRVLPGQFVTENYW
ncbi:MAG TPA: ferredoxin--NADP reductase [Burkholderiaceae bacterium]